MLRHALAHLLHAVADRLDTEPPKPEIQYVYVYPSVPASWPIQPWKSPITYNSPTSIS